MTAQAQLPGVCWTCCGELMIVAEVFDRHGEPALVPQSCPACRPRPAAPETWRAAVALGQRLAWERSAAGR